MGEVIHELWNGRVVSEDPVKEMMTLLYCIDTYRGVGPTPVPTAETRLVNGIPVLQEVPGHPSAEVRGPIVLCYINQTSGV